MSEQSIVISANSLWNIVNFRAGLIRDLKARGFRVKVIAPPDDHLPRLDALGVEFHPIALNSGGLSPFQDLRSLLAYYRLLARLNPAAFLGFTIKPNIYGSLAARAHGIKVINNITGLGVAFMGGEPLRWLVLLLYRMALGRSATIFFQNSDDLRIFTEQGLVRPEQVALLPGSGVDLERFKPVENRQAGPFRFLMLGRMLWDKGVGEYVEAAQMLRDRGHAAEFALLGPAGVDNRGAIPRSQLYSWSAAGPVQYLGASDDVRQHIAKADCVVLPSYYREGIPRSLIEAAAMGKPIITTDEVGCRDAIDDGTTGFLCQARSAESLAAAMEKMVTMPAEELAAMGHAARAKAVRQFDEQLVSTAYLRALDR